MTSLASDHDSRPTSLAPAPATAGSAPDSPEPSAVTRLARTALPLALYLAGLGIAVRIMAFPLSNPDTFFSLRIGREFLDGAWSLREPGSPSSTATADWVPTQWSAQVLMALAERLGGLPAVAWFGGAQLVALVVVLLLGARQRTDLALAVPVVGLALVASISGMSVRPQGASYVLSAVLTLVWLRAARTGRLPWVAVPLCWVWATYHGMWPVGVVVGGVAAVGIALDERAGARRVLRLLAVPAACLAAALCTPVGPRVLSGVLTVTGRAGYFTEWAPVNFSSVNGAAFLVLAGVGVVAVARRRPTWILLGLLLLACLFACWSARTLPVAAAIAVPVVCALLQTLRGTPVPAPGRAERLTVLGGAVGALVVLAVVVPRTATAPAGDWAPVTDRLDALPAGTPVLADLTVGSRLLWQEPRLDVLVHGYADMFTDAELATAVTVTDGRPGWLEAVRSSGARWAVVDPGSTLDANLRTQGWAPVRATDDVALLRPPDGWTS